MKSLSQIAELMGISLNRLRTVLTGPNKPKPLHKGEHYRRGRTPDLYDMSDVLTFYASQIKQKSQMSDSIKSLINKPQGDNKW
jgi:hypothetical protein